MELVANFLMVAGSFLAAYYCRILAKKLAGLNGTDTSLGTAINVLTAQVDLMQNSLNSTRKSSFEMEKILHELVPRAEIAAGRLEILLSTLAKNSRKTDAAPVASRPAENAGAQSEYKLPLQLRSSNRTDLPPAALRNPPQAEMATQSDNFVFDNLKESLRHVLAERGIASPR